MITGMATGMEVEVVDQSMGDLVWALEDRVALEHMVG